MEATHTPGPWRTFEKPTGIEILCGDRHAPLVMPSAGIKVAEVRFGRLGRGGLYTKSPVDELNARLIASTPDLLAALQECALSAGAPESIDWEMVRRALALTTGAIRRDVYERKS